MNSVTINGVSSDTVRLRFDKLPLIPAAKERINTYAIPGAGQDMTLPTGDYDDISMTLTAYLVGGATIQDVYDWIRGGDKITLTTQPNIYGVIKSVGEIAPSRVGWDAHEIDIPLTLSPFKYRIDNAAVQITENPTWLRTIGNVYSFPEIVMHDSAGDIELQVNGTSISIENAPDNVHIDVKKQTIYTIQNGASQNILESTAGNFWEMVLQPGDEQYNFIAWTGTVGTISITKNERWV